MHSGMRLDRTLGISSSFFANMLAGKKAGIKPSDFSPFDDHEDEIAGVDEVFSFLSGIAKKE